MDGFNFVTIGKVAALGNSNSITSYSYEDQSISKGTVYYKITEYDLNGSNQTGNIVSVTNTNEGISIYPNPTEESFIISIKSSLGQNVNISLVNSLGQVVIQRQRFSNSEIMQEDVNISNLSNGTYFLLVQTASGSWSNKVVKK